MEQNKVPMKSIDELTIVTGYFDFGRGEHKQQSRSSQKYFEYFRMWARIKNNVIIYTSSQFAEQVRKIREEFGRWDQTKLIIVDEIENIEPALLEAMKKIEANEIFKLWRARDYDVSNIAMYDYIMLMKYWMLRDAAARYKWINVMVWLDFGWNHGGEVFPNEYEFDFLWQYPFEEEKVHLFVKQEPSKEMGFLKVQTMTDGIMGCNLVCSKKNCEKLYCYVKEALWSLISLDIIDDDQMLLTMAYKLHPELFTLHFSDWFLPMKEYGGSHLTIREAQKGKRSIKIIYDRICEQGIIRAFYLFYIQYIRKETEEKYEFKKRISKIFDKYM